MRAREIEGVKVILPVWHNIGAADIRAYSPTLADRLAVSSSAGLERVVDQLLKAIRQSPPESHPHAAPEQIVDASAHRLLDDYASELHRRRVKQLLVGKAAVAILDGGALVMHVVPFSAIGDKPTGAFEELSRDPRRFRPMSDSGGSYAGDFRISYDGLLVGSNAEGLLKPQRAYVHVFRSGVVEAVQSSLTRGQEHNFLILPQIQASIIKHAHLYIRALGEFSVSPPFAVCVSLINVQDTMLLQDFIPRGAILEDLPRGDLDRNQYDFGQVIFGTVPDNYNATAKSLRPILTHFSNAAGLHSSPYFDTAGNYVLADKL